MFPEVRKPKTLKNCCDDSSMVLIDNRHLGDTIIDRNTDLNGNIITESIYLVLSYLRIGLHTGKKYIYNLTKQNRNDHKYHLLKNYLKY